ncbi:MAG: hypothetical protein ACRENX_00010 [Candidatus Dormibacteria bacterium]
MSDGCGDRRAQEARAIKAERDRLQRERREKEERERRSGVRLRIEKIEAGLLGVCPVCKAEVDTADGAVLTHVDVGNGGAELASQVPCRGTGETMLPPPRTPRDRPRLEGSQD